MNKFLVSLFLLVGSLVAQCDNIEIKSQGDVAQYGDCNQAKSISISGNDTTEVKFPNLAHLETVSITQTQNLITFALPNIQQLKSIKVFDNVQLTVVDLSQLQNVNDLSFQNNPNLNRLQFTNVTNAKNIDFTNNAIATVSGLSVSSADSVTFAGNGNLTEIDFGNLQKVGGRLFVSGNHPTLAAKFPQLTSIGADCTISNLTSVDLTSLKTVSKFINFASNSASNFSLPALAKCGPFSAVGNSNIKTLEVPELESISGTFLVANNTALSTIDFPKLQTVDGALDLTGDLQSIKLPKIQTIKGTWNVQTKSSDFKCEDIKNIQSAVKGGKSSPGCKAGVSDPKPSGDNSSSDTSGAIQLAAQGSLAMGAIFLAGLFM